MATVKKYQSGGSATKKQVSIPKKFEAKGPQKDVVDAFKNKSSNKSSSPFRSVGDMSKTRTMRLLSKDAPNEMQKNGGKMKKAKSGGSFPDLNKDGKVTKADILKGRGVIAKSGMKMAKKPVMKFGGTLSPNKSNVSKYVSNLNKAKSGTKMKRGC
jgi:hypothetical protein